MKLADLRPKWFAEQGRQGQGIVFLCPHCHGAEKPTWLCVAFSNPLDGGTPFPIGKIGTLMNVLYEGEIVPKGQPVCPPGTLWSRSSDSFETLSIMPSVDASPAGCWHGFVTDGGIR